MTDTGQKVKYCPNCGGAMEFDIGKQKIVCKFCGTELDMEDTGKTVQKQDYAAVACNSAAQDDWDDSIRVLTCEQCGAEVTVAANLTSVTCRYCGSTKMVDSQRKAGVAPVALAPFKVQKHEALTIFKTWLKKRFFAPNALKTLAQTDRMNAVYSPFWTFDANGSGPYTGEGGTHYQESYTDKDGKTQTRTKTVWHHVSGFVANAFTNILVYAGQAASKLLSGMRTFDLAGGLIPFEHEYLAGFQAETYTVTPEEGFESAKSTMERELEYMAEQEIRRRYDEARSVHVNVTFSDVKIMHVLLPVWFSGFTYRGKNFTVTVNGMTGEIRGEYPKSPIKIAILVLIILAIVIGLIVIFSQAGQ